MKKLYRYLAVIVLTSTFVSVKAQEVSPVDFMRMNPYQMNSNPAADLPYESVMSLVIGDIGVDMRSTTFRYDNLFDFDAQGRPMTFNPRKFATSLKDSNIMRVGVSEDLFTLYRRLNKGMITFGWRLRANGDVVFNDGAFKLLAYGNSAFLGDANPATVNMKVNAQGYQEFAMGYQRNVNDHLSLGGRAKLLFGIANIATDAAEVKLFTDPSSYALRLQENIGVRTSMPSAITLKNGVLGGNGGFSFSDLFSNTGFGLDLGAEYRFDDHFGLVAAVNDLGLIRWSHNNFQMNGNVQEAGQFYENGDFLFEGLSLEQWQLVSTDSEYRTQFLDTLKQYFKINFMEAERYSTMLNANVLLRGYYDLDQCNRFSAQLQGTLYGSGFSPALTLAYCGSFFDNLSVCATYTAMPGSYDNFGLGLGAMIETCHIYLTTNNLLGCFRPLNASAMNARLGVVFNLWLPERRTIDESGKPRYLE